MNKFLFVILLFAVVIYSAGCKKCYTCQNSCLQCVATYNGHVFSQVLCRDSFSTDAAYNAAVANDTSLGYVCSATAPTYVYHFCVNKPGEANYPGYFDHGGRAPCTAK
jgi:hypothetical protein